MPFTLPNFNLTANIWRNGINVLNPPAVITPCYLSLGRRVLSGPDSTTFSNPTGGVGIDMLYRNMGVPALTDVRPAWTTGGPDTVEVPAGSGVYYKAQDVADMAKGHANEYRFCWLVWNQFLPAAPLPLP
jgi:hypothetical protein